MVLQDPEIVQEFVAESSEHLADIEHQLLDIEAGGSDVDVDLVNTVFRAVHSIKGAAGFMGFDSVLGLSHSLENVLNLMRDGSLLPTSETVDVMLGAADLLRNLIDDIDNSNEMDVSEFVGPLDAIVAGECGDETKTMVQSDSTETAGPVTEEEKEEPEATKEDVQAAVHEEPSPSTQVEAVPSVATPRPEPKAKEAASRTQHVDSNIRVSVEVLDHLMNLAGEMVLGRNQLVQTVQSGDSSGLEAVTMRLDHITSELQEAVMKTRMQPIGNVFGKFTRVVRDLSSKLGKQCSLQIEGKDVEVDKAIVEAIGDPLTHLIRNSVDHGIEMPDAREANGKPASGNVQLRAFHQSGKVKIEITDDGSGIDVNVLKSKAVSKGILTQERADTLSDREATRLIFHPGFSTAVEVTDVSGRGVGMDVVRSNIEKLGGTVDVETQLAIGTTIVVTLPLTLAIIPSLIVESRKQRFAIPQVNIVELVRIRASELKNRIGQVKNKEVLRLRGSLLPLVRLQNALGPAYADDDEMGSDASDDSFSNSESNVRNIIVVEAGSLCYGVIVDALFDSEEIVVKPLGRHLKDCPCLSGATILGDGQVALILDVTGIAQRASLRIAEDDQKGGSISDQNATSSERTHSVLLFANDPGEQFAMLMDAVARIERIRAEQVDSVGGRQLLQYGGGTLTLLSLENLLQAKARPSKDRLYVIVFEAAGREVGILAAQLVDIRDVPVQYDAATFNEPGVFGSYVIDAKTTRLLDTIGLARRARPDWYSAGKSPQVASPPTLERFAQRMNYSDNSDIGNSEVETTSNGATVLLAEDSSFFRHQVKDFLEKAGFDVVDCEDGQKAWKALSSEPNRFQLVLTDIEMPNMDGLELARKIRSEDRFVEMPIVALTSLASQEDYQRGYDAGVNEYQVKLDREELLISVQRLARAATVAV